MQQWPISRHYFGQRKITKILVMLDTNLVKICELPPKHESTVLLLHKLHCLHSIILKSHGPLLKILVLLRLDTAAAAVMQTTVSQLEWHVIHGICTQHCF